MDNFEEEDLGDDFEIEFSELPEEEERSISSSLFPGSSHLRVRVRSIVLECSRRLSIVRPWLLSEVPKNDFADGSSKDESELEIVDLPPTTFNEILRSLPALKVRLSPRMRLLRLAMTGSTVFLALLLFLGGFPSARAWTYNLFVHPTPPALDAALLTAESSQLGIGSGLSPSLQATAEVWDTNATPGPAPLGQSCLASPVHGSAQITGRPPGWVVGFDGPRATLHLSPTPVPVSVFPHKFGWSASITLEIASDYPGLISLHGESSSSGSPLVFSFGRDPSQEQLFILTMSTHQAMVSPGIPGIFKAERPTWNITVYVPTAGCYLLNAAWLGGNWSIAFAAGK